MGRQLQGGDPRERTAVRAHGAGAHHLRAQGRQGCRLRYATALSSEDTSFLIETIDSCNPLADTSFLGCVTVPMQLVGIRRVLRMELVSGLQCLQPFFFWFGTLDSVVIPFIHVM